MLYTKTVAPITLGLLNELMQKNYLQNFVLVGGTALSLQINHRMSIYLDLFSTEMFISSEMKIQLEKEYANFVVDMQMSSSLTAKINDIKVDLILFKYGFAYPFLTETGLRIANIKDIAPMKLDAITGRGKKKDFFDLYFLLQHFTLPELLELYQAKYKHTTLFHVIKSINYFVEAEGQPDPTVLDKKVTWTKVKKKIAEEIRKL